MKINTLLTALAGFALALNTHATVNADEAANYGGTWTAGSNAGGGFEAWEITSADGSGSADFGIWDSSAGGLELGDAFGFVATGDGSSIEISRAFTTVMAEGDVFSIDLAMNYDAGDAGSKGFALVNAAGEDIVVVEQGDSDAIEVNGISSLTNYGTATMYWTFTQESSSTLHVFATGRGGSENHADQIVTSSAYVAGIRFFASAVSNDAYTAERSVYFDQLSLAQGALSGATFIYEVEDSEATITSVSEAATGAMIVPATLGGYPVTAIARAAFMDCVGLSSLSFADGASLTSIGPAAFQGCAALQSATVPAGLADVPDSLFQGCANLRTVILPTGVETIGNSAFAGCRALVGIDLPAGLTSLGESVFLNCRALASLEIPEGITEVPGQLGYECRALAHLVLPPTVTNIGYRAFYNCAALETLTLPAAVVRVEDGAFQNCSGLTTLVFEGTLATIADEAFYGCANLTALYFNGGIDLLADVVFGNCESLTELYIKSDVPTLDTGADLFIGTDQVTIYTAANPSNWGSSFAGAPVAVWAPAIVEMRLVDEEASFTVEWEGEGEVILLSRTNLLEGAWVEVDTNTLSAGTCELTDPAGLSADHRFYQIQLR